MWGTAHLVRYQAAGWGNSGMTMPKVLGPSTVTSTSMTSAILTPRNCSRVCGAHAEVVGEDGVCVGRCDDARLHGLAAFGFDQRGEGLAFFHGAKVTEGELLGCDLSYGGADVVVADGNTDAGEELLAGVDAVGVDDDSWDAVDEEVFCGIIADGTT